MIVEMVVTSNVHSIFLSFAFDCIFPPGVRYFCETSISRQGIVMRSTYNTFASPHKCRREP